MMSLSKKRRPRLMISRCPLVMGSNDPGYTANLSMLPSPCEISDNRCSRWRLLSVRPVITVTRPFLFRLLRPLQPEKAQCRLPVPTAVFDLIPLTPRRDLFPDGVLDDENSVLRHQRLCPDEPQSLADQVSLIRRVGKDDVEQLSPMSQELKAAIDGNLDHFDI